MTNIYESRYVYLRKFVEGKTLEHTIDQTPDDVRKVVYTTINHSLSEMHTELEPSHEDEFRFAMWAMVGAAYEAAETFLAVNLETANYALDVAEELAAIITTYYPRDGVDRPKE